MCGGIVFQMLPSFNSVKPMTSWQLWMPSAVDVFADGPLIRIALRAKFYRCRVGDGCQACRMRACARDSSRDRTTPAPAHFALLNSICLLPRPM